MCSVGPAAAVYFHSLPSAGFGLRHSLLLASPLASQACRSTVDTHTRVRRHPRTRAHTQTHTHTHTHTHTCMHAYTHALTHTFVWNCLSNLVLFLHFFQCWKGTGAQSIGGELILLHTHTHTNTHTHTHTMFHMLSASKHALHDFAIRLKRPLR